MLRRVRSSIRQQPRPALGDAPQHGVDQLDEALRAAVAPGRLHRKIDDRMGRHVEADELRRTREQDRPQPPLVGRQRPLQKRGQHMLQLALPTQHRRRHRPRQRPVARLHGRELRPRRLRRQHQLQRLFVHQHAGDQMHRQVPRRQPRRGALVVGLLLLWPHACRAFHSMPIDRSTPCRRPASARCRRRPSPELVEGRAEHTSRGSTSSPPSQTRSALKSGERESGRAPSAV